MKCEWVNSRMTMIQRHNHKILCIQKTASQLKVLQLCVWLMASSTAVPRSRPTYSNRGVDYSKRGVVYNNCGVEYSKRGVYTVIVSWITVNEECFTVIVEWITVIMEWNTVIVECIQ